MFPELEKIKDNGGEFEITSANKDLVKEVQSLLQTKGLYKDKIDGIPGPLTQKGLTEFKKKVWLDKPLIIGKTTAAALLEIVEDHKVSEQKMSVMSTSATDNEGKTKFLTLITGERVFASQFVVPGVSLTWGEITKNCDPERNPESKEIIDNIIFTAKKFGAIRDKFNNPIGITSAYRTPKVNASVGGARRSQHIQGLALDIYPLNGELEELWKVCLFSDCIGLGDGRKRGFVHVDWRDRGKGVRTVFGY